MRRIFLWINFVLASLIVLLVFAQAYFTTAYVTGAGESALDTHGFIGFAIIHPAELLVFLTAFGAGPRAWKWIGFKVFPLFLGTVDSFPGAARRGPGQRLGARVPRHAGAGRRGDGRRDRAPRHARPRAQACFARRRA